MAKSSVYHDCLVCFFFYSAHLPLINVRVPYSETLGMPDILLSISNRKLLSPGSFGIHSCVRTQKFNDSGILSFIPPDGQFQLFDYTIDVTHSPFVLKPAMRRTSTGGTLCSKF